MNVGKVLTGVSKGSFESKRIVKSRPLAVALLHKRKGGKHEESSPLQPLSQGTGAITQAAEAQPRTEHQELPAPHHAHTPAPAHPPPPKCQHHQKGQCHFTHLNHSCVGAVQCRCPPCSTWSHPCHHRAEHPAWSYRQRRDALLTRKNSHESWMEFFTLFWEETVRAMTKIIFFTFLHKKASSQMQNDLNLPMGGGPEYRW